MKKYILLFVTLIPSICFSATRTKTIEYAFTCSTSNVSAEQERQFSVMSASIPETTGRVFKSVFGIYYVYSASAAAATITNRTIKLRIDANAYQINTNTASFVNSGEQESWVFIEDYTSYFNDYYTGTNHNIDSRFFVKVASTNNCSAKLVITYDYDDSATTRIKTVRIPINSSTFTLTTNLIQLNGMNAVANVPALDTILPESGKVYRDIFFEVKSNEVTTTAGTDPQLGISLDDNRAAWYDAAHMDDLASARYYYYIYKTTYTFEPDREHKFKATTTNSASMPFSSIGANMIVTYEYDHANSNRIYNSVLMSNVDSYGFMVGPSTDKAFIQDIKLQIPEPGTITLSTSSVMVYYSDTGSSDPLAWAGQQQYSTYSVVALVQCGQRLFNHRIDDNGGFNIQRGTNSIEFRLMTKNTMANNSRLHILGNETIINYISDKSSLPGGDANHNHTVFNHLIVSSAPNWTGNIYFSTWNTVINESDYYLNDVTFKIIEVSTGAQTYTSNWMSMGYDVSERQNMGFFPFGNNPYAKDGELGIYYHIYNGLRYFKSNPGDLKPGKLDIENTRKVYALDLSNDFFQGYTYTTYHTSTFSVSGAITNYTGDGSGITISAYSTGSQEKLFQTTTAIGGTFIGTAYDNTIPIIVSAYQDSTHSGVTLPKLAGSSFDIDFGSTSGGGGTNSYISFQ